MSTTIEQIREAISRTREAREPPNSRSGSAAMASRSGCRLSRSLMRASVRCGEKARNSGATPSAAVARSVSAASSASPGASMPHQKMRGACGLGKKAEDDGCAPGMAARGGSAASKCYPKGIWLIKTYFLQLLRQPSIGTLGGYGHLRASRLRVWTLANPAQGSRPCRVVKTGCSRRSGRCDPVRRRPHDHLLTTFQTKALAPASHDGGDAMIGYGFINVWLS